MFQARLTRGTFSLLVVSSSLFCALPAFADGGAFQLRSGQLPDASQFPKSRLKVQLVDTAPEVTDHRKNQSQENFVINIPAIPAATSSTVVIGDPSGIGAPVVVPIRRSNLPASSFGSNIPSGGIAAPARLPKGTSTNGLGAVAGRMLDRVKAGRSGGIQGAPQGQMSAGPAPIRTYSPQASSGASTIRTQGTASQVIGKLLK